MGVSAPSTKLPFPASIFCGCGMIAHCACTVPPQATIARPSSKVATRMGFSLPRKKAPRPKPGRANSRRRGSGATGPVLLARRPSVELVVDRHQHFAAVVIGALQRRDELEATRVVGNLALVVEDVGDAKTQVRLVIEAITDRAAPHDPRLDAAFVDDTVRVAEVGLDAVVQDLASVEVVGTDAAGALAIDGHAPAITLPAGRAAHPAGHVVVA